MSFPPAFSLWRQRGFKDWIKSFGHLGAGENVRRIKRSYLVKEDKSSSSPTEALDEVKKIAKKSFSSFVSSSAQRTKFSSPFDPARVRYYEIKK